MKKLKYLLVCLMTVSLLAGCGSSEGEKPSPIIDVTGEDINTPAPDAGEQAPPAGDVATPEATEEPGEDEAEKADSAVIGEREVVDGQMQSYLTGQWMPEEVAKRRPMAVMIGNNIGLLPQWGLSKAAIIYEAPVEGRISRLMAIIEDYDELEMVGPVRSSRDYFVYEAMAYDAIYCNWGLAIPYVEELLKSDRIDNVSQALKGIHNPSPEAFFRRDRPGYSTEYTGYMSISGYTKAVGNRGYSETYRNTFEQAFTFANDGWVSEYSEYPDATVIYPGGNSANKSGYGDHKPRFEYNADDGLYYRYQFGAAHIDEMTGEQLTVSNVVFKICHGEQRDPNDYLAFGVHGEGDAYIFTNGKVIKGTWSRSSDSAANMFYDDKGNEIVLNQGQTWICCIWEEYANYMSWN